VSYRERFDQAVRPLGELVGELDAEILQHEKALSELRELRRNVKQVLRTLEPKAPAKPPKPKPPVDRVKKDRVLAHIATGPDRDITAPGLKNNGLGDPPISLGALYGILDELRDDGLLRVDRIGKGGQKVYRRTVS